MYRIKLNFVLKSIRSSRFSCQEGNESFLEFACCLHTVAIWSWHSCFLLSVT